MQRCAASIAAYAVALQALLWAFAAAPTHAAGAAFEICRSDRADAPASDSLRDSCLACVAGHCAGSAAPPARVALAAPWPVGGTPLVAALRPGIRSSSAVREQPHSPRAPPLG